MTDTNGMDRRSFVKALGGGILVCVNLGPLTACNSSAGPSFQRGYPEDINAYLHIAEDGQKISKWVGYLFRVYLLTSCITGLDLSLALFLTFIPKATANGLGLYSDSDCVPHIPIK